MMKVDQQQVDITTSTGTTSYSVAKSSIFDGRKILIDQSQSYSGTIYTVHKMPEYLTKTISFALLTEGNLHDIYKDIILVGNMTSHGAMPTNAKLDFKDVPVIGEEYNCAFGTTLTSGSDLTLISSIKNFHSLCAVTCNSMFLNQTGLKQAINLEFDGYGNGTTINASGMFNGCTGLNTVSIKFNDVANIGSMFKGCTSLNENSNIVIESEYSLLGTAIFENCTGFTKIPEFIKNWKLASAASFCTGWTGLLTVQDSDLPEIFSNVTSWSYTFALCTNLLSVSLTIPTKVTTCTYLFQNDTALNENNINISCDHAIAADSMFYNTGLTIIPTQLQNIQFTSLQSTFAACKKLKAATLTIPEKTTNCEYLFKDDTALTTVTVTCENDHKIDAYYMFAGCTALTTTPEFMKTCKFSKLSYTFNGCTKLTTATINVEGLTASTTYITNMFNNCTALTDITFLNASEALQKVLIQTNLKCPTTATITFA